ncbi:MAG: site-specific tyrosine recombinase XerD [bacterium]|nr:site-specific tyrosine recombinase XerD [bacterium]
MTDDILEGFKNHLLIKGSSHNTEEAYERDIKKMFKFFEPLKIHPVKATSENINAFILYLEDTEKMEMSSVARIVAAIREFYRFLVDEEIMPDSPINSLHAPKLTKHLPNVLSPEEVNLIIEQANKIDPIGLRDRAMLEVLYGSGLRISELLNLKMSNMINGMELLRFYGKGNKERIVPIGSYTKKAIEMYLTNGRPILKKDKGKDFDVLFLNYNGKQLSRMGGWKIITKYVKLSGINREVTPHTFRHSFATALLEGGANLRVVQELLGHSSITTTEIYTHIDREKLKEAVRTCHPRG